MATAAHPTPARLRGEQNQQGSGGAFAPAADPASQPLLHDWSQATPGDLRLLASALRRRWPVPSYLPALAVRAALASEDDACAIAAAWVVLRADEANLEGGG
jgi:hypothetical protein